MYDVAKFIPSKREDWDNGCGPTYRADLDALRYERTRSPMGEIVWQQLCERAEGGGMNEHEKAAAAEVRTAKAAAEAWTAEAAEAWAAKMWAKAAQRRWRRQRRRRG